MTSLPLMEEKEPWCFTVVRANGLRLMRSEKQWKPIITVEVDKHHRHETVLGVDGQNPNLKETFRIHETSLNSQVEIKVWYRSASKKRSKKRSLVASTIHSFCELQKRGEGNEVIELRLQCQSHNCRAISSRGRSQNGAVLLVKLRAPSYLANQVSSTSSLTPVPSDSPPAYDPEHYHSDASISSISSSSSDCSSANGTFVSHAPKSHDVGSSNRTVYEGQTIRRRRKIQGYLSDDVLTDAFSDSSCAPTPGFGDFASQMDRMEKEHPDSVTIYEQDEAVRISPPDDAFRVLGEVHDMIAASLLPQYAEVITQSPELTRMERILASFTPYKELQYAYDESQLKACVDRLRSEWTYTGGLLVGIAAVDSAIFAISPDAIFPVDSVARGAVRISSMFAGLGLACDSWMLMQFGWCSLDTFSHNAKGLNDSYAYFAITSRFPSLATFITSTSLMLFLIAVASDVWGTASLVICVVVGVLMSLQFLVFGAHWCASKVAVGGRAAVRGVRRLTMPTPTGARPPGPILATVAAAAAAATAAKKLDSPTMLPPPSCAPAAGSSCLPLETLSHAPARSDTASSEATYVESQSPV